MSRIIVFRPREYDSSAAIEMMLRRRAQQIETREQFAWRNEHTKGLPVPAVEDTNIGISIRFIKEWDDSG